MRKVRRKIGKLILGNCWIVGLIFLIANFGKIKKVMIRANHVKNHPKDTNCHLIFELKTGNIVHFGATNKEFLTYPLLSFVQMEIFNKKYLRKEATYKTLLNKRA